MRRLPRLSFGSSEWALPLADRSARGLAAALLSPSRGACRERLAALLAEAPALALWTVCQAHLLDDLSITTCQMAAEWLDDHLLARFDWQTVDTVEIDETASATSERFAQLAGTAIVTGRVAGRLAEANVPVCPKGGSCPNQALFAGLLHGARNWFDIAPAMRADTAAVAAWLPSWLADLTTGNGTTNQTDAGPLVCAQQAAAMIAGSADAGSTTGLAGDAYRPAALRDAVREAARDWVTSDLQARVRLPVLLSKLARLSRLERRFHAELETAKLDAMKELAYGAGHEINNPLANISVRAQTLIKDESNPERRRKLAAINRQAFRAHEMIADLMLFARPPELHLQPVDLVELIATVVGELAPDAAARAIAVEHRRPTPELKIVGDPVQLGVALRALCVNSLEAIGRDGQIHIEARDVPGGSAPTWAELVVADTGPGIVAAVRYRLFDPFFSGREAGRGLGFGLSKCWRIVTDHGGHIVVDSPARGGAVFTIRLPASGQPTALPDVARE